MCYTNGKYVANFKRFLRDVNKEIESEVGLSKDDLPDYDYNSAFEDGFTPNETAGFALEAAGYIS